MWMRTCVEAALPDASNVEADVQDVAVAHDVGLPLEPLLPLAGDLRVRAQFDQVAPVDDFAPDEAAGDVGVDRAGGIERGLAVAQRPRPRLLFAGGEERDQVERAGEPAGDVLERRLAAVAEC